jgi:hypothetical protein
MKNNSRLVTTNCFGTHIKPELMKQNRYFYYAQCYIACPLFCPQFFTAPHIFNTLTSPMPHHCAADDIRSLVKINHKTDLCNKH